MEMTSDPNLSTFDRAHIITSQRQDENSYSAFPSPLSPAPLFIPCDNPQNLVSPRVAETVDFAVYAGIFPVLVTWGVITNVINMAVFVRQGLSDRIHLCLFSLALSDTGFLLFLMAGKSYAVLGLVDPVAASYWRQRHNGPVLGSYLACLSLSNLITALIAVERALAILTPLTANRIFRTKYMAVGILVTSVYILTTMNVSLSLKYQTVTVTDPLTNASTFISQLTPTYLQHATLIEVLYTYVLCVTLPLMSLVVVIVCTVAIIVRLKVTATWRRQSVSNMTSSVPTKREASVTRMLVTVCAVYLMCITPNVVKNIVLFLRIPGFLVTGHLCNVFEVTLALTHVLEAVNASVNFCIYFRQSSRYRSTLRQTCLCLAVRRQEKKKSEIESRSS